MFSTNVLRLMFSALLIAHCLLHLKQINCAELPSEWRHRIHPSVSESEEALTRADIIWEDAATPGYPMLAAEEPGSGHIVSGSNYWPNSGQCIPYRLHPAFDEETKQRIRNAMNTIERRTDHCLSFKIQTEETEYISIVPAGRGCMSHVGIIPGRTTEIRLGSGCMKDGIILHELLHALGFYHEQNRPDRDEFVQVFTENIQPNMYELNYGILPHMPTHGLQYDYESILHHAAWNFAKSRDKPAIIPKIRSPVRMGQRK